MKLFVKARTQGRGRLFEILGVAQCCLDAQLCKVPLWCVTESPHWGSAPTLVTSCTILNLTATGTPWLRPPFSPWQTEEPPGFVTASKALRDLPVMIFPISSARTLQITLESVRSSSSCPLCQQCSFADSLGLFSALFQVSALRPPSSRALPCQLIENCNSSPIPKPARLFSPLTFINFCHSQNLFN